MGGVRRRFCGEVVAGPWLRGRSGPDTVRPVAILRTGERELILPARCLIGRAPACDLVLAEKTVSGQHAVIQWSGAAWELRDLGSRNGTYLDDAKLGPGASVALAPQARIRFGRGSPTWTLIDVGAPTLMAIRVPSGAVCQAEGGYLALPDAQSAELCVYQDPQGAWIVEQAGVPGPLEDRAVLATQDGARWRIHVPTALAGTLKDSDGSLLVANLRLRFVVSRDEEHVQLVALWGERRLDLQARAHHYPLLTLARQRAADCAAGLPEGEQGWIHQDELTRMLRMDDNHLNICIHRARAQLGKLGVHDAASLVERRAGSRLLRLGARAVEIVAA